METHSMLMFSNTGFISSVASDGMHFSIIQKEFISCPNPIFPAMSSQMPPTWVLRATPGPSSLKGGPNSWKPQV